MNIREIKNGFRKIIRQGTEESKVVKTTMGYIKILERDIIYKNKMILKLMNENKELQEQFKIINEYLGGKLNE